MNCIKCRYDIALSPHFYNSIKTFPNITSKSPWLQRNNKSSTTSFTFHLADLFRRKDWMWIKSLLCLTYIDFILLTSVFYSSILPSKSFSSSFLQLPDIFLPITVMHKLPPYQSLVEKQKGLTTSHLHTQLDPYVSKLMRLL